MLRQIAASFPSDLHRCSRKQVSISYFVSENCTSASLYLWTLMPIPKQFRTEVEIINYILSCLQSLNVCFFLWEVSDASDVHKYTSHYSYKKIILLVCFTCKCFRASRPGMKLFWRFLLSVSSYENGQYYSVADFAKEILQVCESDSWRFAGLCACCLESRD